MSLVLQFDPGDTVRINQVCFHITWNPPAIGAPGQPSVVLTDEPAPLFDNVSVALAFRQKAGCIGIAFNGPRTSLIIRVARGEDL